MKNTKTNLAAINLLLIFLGGGFFALNLSASNDECAGSFGDEAHAETLLAFLQGNDSSANVRAQQNANKKAIEDLKKSVSRISEQLKENEDRSQSFFWFMHSLLTPSQVQELRSRIARSEEGMKALEKENKGLKAQVEKSGIEALKNALLAPEYNPYVVEMLKLLRVESLEKSRTVSLSFGNGEAELDPTQVQELESLVRGLRAMNYQIIFDADSRAAPIISTLVGRDGLGISISEKKFDLNSPVVRFENPYHKFVALRHARLTVIDPASPAGLALFFTGDARVILDSSKAWPAGIEQWHKDLEYQGLNIGLKIDLPKITASAEDILNLKFKDEKTKESKPIFTSQEAKQLPGHVRIENLGQKSIERIRDYIRLMALEAADVRKSGGAVLFGSSGLHRRFTPQTYEFARALSEFGLAMRTGGAGGLMMAANMAAYDAGGISIGIPKIGSDLQDEQFIPTLLHTHTIKTYDYASRIGLLMHRPDVAVFVPGRTGTMREVGIALMIAGAGSSKAPVVFIHRAYYEPLLQWLKQSPASLAFASSLHLIDQPSELISILETLPNLERHPPYNPRNNRHEFPWDHSDLEAP